MKKLSKVLVSTLLMFSVTGCSFLEGFLGEDGDSAYVSKKIKDLDVDKENRKTTFVVGDEFVKPKVTATYEDGTTEDVTDKCTFSGYNMSTAGEQKVSVKYGNWTLTYTITVHEGSVGKVATKITFEGGYKPNYVQGDAFVKPKVVATFEDGTTEDVTDKCTFSEVNMNLIGKQEVTCKFQKLTISFDIEITEKYAEVQNDCYLSEYEKTIVVDEPHRFYYFHKVAGQEDEKYDNQFMTLVGTHYSVEDETIVSINDHGEIVGLKAGTTYVHCINTRAGEVVFDFRCLVKVEDKKPTTLEIINYREKYYTGQQFNFMCHAKVTYQTGYQEEVTPSVNSGSVNMAVPGTYNVEIYYSLNGVKASVTKPVQVLDSSLYQLNKVALDYHMDDLWRNSTGITAMPTTGNVKMLTIPVKFTDSDQFISNYTNVKEDIHKAFFGTNEECGWRSVKTFYEEESKNLISISGTTSNWYNSGLSYKDCYDPANIATLKNNAVEWYFDNNPTEDRKSYDADRDGYIDGLSLIFAAPDYSTGHLEGEGAGNLWAMVKTVGNQQKNVNKPVSCKFMWASYDSLYATRAIALERTGKSNYSENDKYGESHATYWGEDTRTYIHETGHMLGLFDYYSSTENNIYPAGHTNIQTLNFLSHDPYSLLQYGWAEPYIPEFTQTITITDFQDNHDVIMLKPNNSIVNSPFDEYILIDLYAPTGLNKFNSIDHPLYYGPHPRQEDLTTVGVRLWHVDARLMTASSGYTEFTTNPTAEKVGMRIGNSYYENDDPIYREFLELALIRNDTEIDYRHLSHNKAADYFYAGDEFTVTKFSKQFPNGTKLDSGVDLGWTVKVDGIYQVGDKYSADITVTKL